MISNKFVFREMKVPVVSYYFLIFGFVIVILGMYSNFLVIYYNHGLMPVWNGSDEFGHFPIIDISSVNYLFLADIYPLGNYVFSLGDFLLTVGWAFIASSQIIVFSNCFIKYKPLIFRSRYLSW